MAKDTGSGGGGATSSVYTMLLLLALVALFFGCIFLYLEMATYGFKVKPSAGNVSIQSLVDFARLV